TGLVNALRGHLAEFGVIAPQGLRNVGKLIAIVRDEGDARLPDLVAKCYRCWRHRLSSWRRRLRRSRSNSWPGTRATASASAWRAFRASALSSPQPSLPRWWNRAAFAMGASSRPGWVWCHDRIPPAANIAWAGYPSAATNLCAGF